MKNFETLNQEELQEVKGGYNPYEMREIDVTDDAIV
ncbi:MAG: bacteriocin class II family protein [Marinifilaceae bacterium]